MSDTTPALRRTRVSPRTIAAIIIVLITLNGVILAWRWASAAELPPGTYHEYQIQQWELESLERPDDPVVWATLGGLYESAGDEARAESAYARALELDPENAAALVFTAQARQRDGDSDEARSLLMQAIDALPEGNTALVYFRLGQLEEAAGDPEAALDAYTTSVEQRSTYWNAHFRIAVIQENAGSYPEALKAAEQAARFAPDDEVVQMVLERIRASAGEDTTGADDD